tara:strand:+ start:6091 stop:6576 length:486 start_codon:yes stop_codon:yes gene_type:complete
MAIVVEDGTGSNSAANSYVSEADLTTYATDRGITLVKSADQLLLLSMDTIETRSYQGDKNSTTQPLSWPRTGVVVNGSSIDTDEIPSDLKTAQIVTALSIDAGVNPMGKIDPAVKRKKVDVIEIEYKDNAASRSFDPKINAYLASLLAYGGGMSNFSVTRA